MSTGLVRKAIRDGRASTADEDPTPWDEVPDLRERALARIGEIEEEVATLPAGEHKMNLLAERRKLRREVGRS
jgi:hypothetical protein